MRPHWCCSSCVVGLHAIVLVLVGVSTGCAPDASEAYRRYMNSADGYAARNQYSEAAVEYRNAIKYRPSAGEAFLKLAESYLAIGYGPAALTAFVRAADLMPDNDSAQLKAANMLLIAGQFKETEIRVRRVLEHDSQNIDALVLLGNALTNMRDFDGALQEIDEAMALAPSSPSPYLVLGRLKLAQGQNKEAEIAYSKAVAADPTSVEAQLAAGRYYWIAGDSSKAEAHFRTALNLDPDGLRTNRVMASFYLASHRTREAERYLAAVARNAHDVRSQLALADYYVLTSRTDEARRILNPLVERPQPVPDGRTHAMADAGTRLAALADREGRPGDANQMLDRVLKQSPDHVPALMLKTRLLLVGGHVDEALVMAKRAAGADSRSPAAHYLVGVITAARGEREQAIDAFEQVSNLAPRAPEPLVQLSRLHVLEGHTSMALEYARRALEVEPRLLEAHLAFARAQLAGGAIVQAQLALTSLVQKFPNSGGLHALLGTLHIMRNNRDAARTSFTRALELDPDSIEALAGLIALDASSHQMADATRRAEARLKRTPDDVAATLLAARTYMIAGRGEYGEPLLRRIISMEPANLEAYAALGQLFVSQRRIDEARKEFEQLAVRMPASVSAGTMLAVILHLQGRLSEAVQQYERVVAIDAGAAVAANNLAWLYAEGGGNLDRAVQLAEAAHKQLPNRPEVADTLGWVYYKKDLLSLAIGAFQQSVKRDPSNPSYRYHLGLSYARRGEVQQARVALRQALQLRRDFDGAKDAAAVLESLPN